MTTLEGLNIYAPGLKLLGTTTDDDDAFLNMAWSPDGQSLALASDHGGLLATINSKSFALSWYRVGAFGGVNDVAWSPEGDEVVCICGDGTLLKHSLIEKQNNRIYGDTATTKSVTWSIDGRLIAVGGHYERQNVIVLDAMSGERFGLSAQSTARPVFFNDSRRLACVYMSETPLTIWDVRTGVKLQEFSNRDLDDGRTMGHFGPVTALALAPDERLIATGGADACVTLWDVESGNPIRELQESQGRIHALDFSPDGSFLVSTSADNVLRIWSAQRDWRQVVQLPDLEGGWSGGIAFHPSQRLLATGARGGHAVHFWEYNPVAWR